MAREYDKLVRDDIPGIIRENGEVPVAHVADEGEYRERLVDKLREEIDEYAESRGTEELADVLEVVRAIAQHEGLSMAELEETREQKAAERGGFEERIVLETVREP